MTLSVLSIFKSNNNSVISNAEFYWVNAVPESLNMEPRDTSRSILERSPACAPGSTMRSFPPMPQICSKQHRGKASFALAIPGKQLELTGKLQRKAEANSWHIQSSARHCFLGYLEPCRRWRKRDFELCCARWQFHFPQGGGSVAQTTRKKRLLQNVKTFESKRWRLWRMNVAIKLQQLLYIRGFEVLLWYRPPPPPHTYSPPHIAPHVHTYTASHWARWR